MLYMPLKILGLSKKPYQLNVFITLEEAEADGSLTLLPIAACSKVLIGVSQTGTSAEMSSTLLAVADPTSPTPVTSDT